MRSLVAACIGLLVTSLGACASWSADPTLSHERAWRLPPACPENNASDNAQLCHALTQAHDTADNYLQTAQDLDGEHQLATAAQFVSALGLASFTAFDSAQDNRTAALIVGGAATGYQTSLHPAESARVLLQGYASLRCVDLAAAPFLQPSARSALERRLATAAQLSEFSTALPAQFSSSIVQSHAAAPAGSAALYFASGQMLARISTRADVLSERLRRDAGAQQNAHLRVDSAVQAIREFVRASLARRPADLQGYARLLAELSPKAETPPAPAGVMAQSLFRLDANAFDLTSASGLVGYAAVLDAGMDRLMESTPDGADADDFAAISACVPAMPSAPSAPE